MRILASCILIVVAVSAQSTDSEASLTCSCGSRNRNRIVGGQETLRNEFPLIVALMRTAGGSHFCGGSIITPWHVLTAAHCTHTMNASQITLGVGQHERTGNSAEARIRVARIINHERYNHSTVLNDIALLLTATEMRFTSNVGPVCMPTRRLNLVGQRLTAIGWGLTTHQGRQAERLQNVDLTVIANNRCIDMYRSVRIRPNNATNMCTFEPQRDTCQGDSGGPLVFTDPQTNRLTLAALVSYGGACAGSLPGVNTDVSAYIDWVNRNVASSRQGTRTCHRA